MKRTTRHLQLFLALVLCFSVFMALTVSAEAGNFKKEYKMQINVGPQFYWGMGANKFVELVKQRTNGQINIKPYWGSQLLKGAQLKSAQLVSNGVIDLAMESTINISPVITEANIFSLPFFINNFENLDKMEYGQTGKAIFKAMDAKGLVGLAWAENGFRQVTNSKIAIRTPADVKGLRLRVVGSPIFIHELGGCRHCLRAGCGGRPGKPGRCAGAGTDLAISQVCHLLELPGGSGRFLLE